MLASVRIHSAEPTAEMTADNRTLAKAIKKIGGFGSARNSQTNTAAPGTPKTAVVATKAAKNDLCASCWSSLGWVTAAEFTC